jgi:hypothetical protein
MEHMIEDSILFDDIIDTSSLGSISRLRKLTPQEEDDTHKKIEINNEIYGSDKVSDSIFANVQKYCHEEYQYLNLLQNILENGTWEEGRNGKTKVWFFDAFFFS